MPLPLSDLRTIIFQIGHRLRQIKRFKYLGSAIVVNTASITVCQPEMILKRLKEKPELMIVDTLKYTDDFEKELEKCLSRLKKKLIEIKPEPGKLYSWKDPQLFVKADTIDECIQSLDFHIKEVRKIPEDQHVKDFIITRQMLK